MCNRRTAGFTLVEMIIAIVIIGVGLAGVLLAFNTTVKSSADPMIHKQMLAVAEEIMEEVLLKPFTPPAGGFTQSNTSWPVACAPATAARRTDFDDVSDYDKYQTTGICDIDGVGVVGLASYGLKVTVESGASVSLGGLSGATVAKRVTVDVTRGGETISLIGWRTNFGAP